MSTGTLIKKAMSDALKDLLTVKPLNKIHIKEITDKCGLSRHTFYNHFQDIYDLLRWTYTAEITDGIDKCCCLASWQEGIELMLSRIYKNKKLCLNIFHSIAWETFAEFLFTSISQFLNPVIGEISAGLTVSDTVKKECNSFYTNALVGTFINWLRHNLSEPPEKIAYKISHLLIDSITHTLTSLSEEENTL